MYYGWSPDTYVVDANGATDRLHSLWVEVRFVESASLVPWGLWIVEQALIRQVVPGVERLSGSGMRQDFYFGTSSPGNTHVEVSTSKYGLGSTV